MDLYGSHKTQTNKRMPHMGTSHKHQNYKIQIKQFEQAGMHYKSHTGNGTAGLGHWTSELLIISTQNFSLPYRTKTRQNIN